MAQTETTNRDTAQGVVIEAMKMGRYAEDMFEESKDIRVLQTAIAAYGLATKTALAQVQYKKLSGTPEKIEFFED